MPTIGLNRDELFRQLNKEFTEAEFDQLCFDFGVELDEVTSEKQQKAKEQGDSAAKGLSEDVIYKIDIPANRYDLLCMEGLVHSLKVFLGQNKAPKFLLKEPSSGIRQKLIVKENTKSVRPFVVAAILRNVNLNQQAYDSFIDLQDKLHQNIGRKRSLVSIGTHDLDTVKGPFVYDAQNPKKINFVALGQEKSHNAVELMEIFKETHLKSYLHLLEDKDKYPVIRDANGIVMSMPPIINGEHSKITLSSRNIFIEITATDQTKANITLDIITTLFSYHCDDQFNIEPVDVEFADGSVTKTPEIPYRVEKVNADYLNKTIGIDISACKISEILTKMCLESSVTNPRTGEISVTIPPTRSDILHKIDILEDVAIAYGFDNIEKTLPSKNSISGELLKVNKMTDRLRNEIVGAGYVEALSFILCSREDCSSKMLLPEETIAQKAVTISNPKTLDFQIVRTQLLPGLLKTLASNRNLKLPVKLFEIQEIVQKNEDKHGTGAKNQRNICAVFTGTCETFEPIQNLTFMVLEKFGMKFSEQKENAKSKFYLTKVEHPSYLTCAAIMLEGKSIGECGIIHPRVLKNFKLKTPVSAVEIHMECLY